MTEDYLMAHIFSADRRYLYGYVRGEDSLRVWDMATGQQERLPLPQDPSLETEGDSRRDKMLVFWLWLDADRAEIWLFYRETDAPREDPEAIRQAEEKYPGQAFDAFVYAEGEPFRSIVSLEPILRRYPGYVTAYEGDGFIYLDYTGLRTTAEDVAWGISPDYLQIALEDYDSGSFYQVTHSNDNRDGSFYASKDLSLEADAEQKTRALLEELGIQIQPAYRDYRPYLTDDPVLLQKIRLAEMSYERMYVSLRGFFVWENNGYTGVRWMLESNEDIQEMLELVAYSDTLTYEKVKDEASLYRNHTFTVECHYRTDDRYDIVIGRRNGTPFLEKNGYVATMSEADYTRWSQWLKAKEIKGQSEPTSPAY